MANVQLCRNCLRPIHGTSLQWRGSSFHYGQYTHTGGGDRCWISRELRDEVATPMVEADVVGRILTKYNNGYNYTIPDGS